MSELIRRPFDWSRLSEETKEKIEAIQESIREVADKDIHEAISHSLDLLEIIEQEKELQKEKYPENPPNNSCHNAILTGFMVSNESGLKLHDFTPYFSIENEKVYIWTHSHNNYSSLVVDVNTSVKSKYIWRNLASILELTVGINSCFENMIKCNYDWIYNFHPKKTLEDSEFLELENYNRLSGSIHKISFLAENASLIELLIRDECFYVMAMNLLTSFYNHHFCIICAYRKDSYQEHPNHELPIWQIAQTIPQMEVAIVQATRTVEAALGKPGKRDDPSKYQRVLTRWKNAININPSEIFSVANRSYIDYYYEMFGIRGEAAHSLGYFPYKLSRKLTIDAQCFAWEVFKSYYLQHSLDNAKAKEVLYFNNELIQKDPANWSTKMTADSDSFPHYSIY